MCVSLLVFFFVVVVVGFWVTCVPHPHLPSWSDMTESSIWRKKDIQSATGEMLKNLLSGKKYARIRI